MKEKRFQLPSRQIIVRALGTLAAFALLVYLLTQQGWDEILAAVRQIAIWRLALAMGLMMISRLAVSARWYMLLRSAGVDISPAQALRINFAGLFANNFLPTTIGGDAIRLAGALQLRFDAAISTASLVVDRLVGMAGMAMMLPFGLPRLVQANLLQSSLLESQTSALGVAVPFLGKWGKLAWEKGMKLVGRIAASLAIWLKQPRALLISLVLTWIHMLCMFTILTLMFEGMGQDMPMWLSGGLYSIVYFVTLLPFSINGYGLQELSMTLIFSSLGGASLEAGLAAALLFRTFMMVASLPGVIYVPAMLSGAGTQKPKTT